MNKMFFKFEYYQNVENLFLLFYWKQIKVIFYFYFSIDLIKFYIDKYLSL